MSSDTEDGLYFQSQSPFWLRERQSFWVCACAQMCVREGERAMKGKVVCFSEVITADAADTGGLPWTFLSHPLPLTEGDLRAVLNTGVYITNAEALGAGAAATLVSVDNISMHCV